MRRKRGRVESGCWAAPLPRSCSTVHLAPMIGIAVSENSKSVTLVGDGLTLTAALELTSGVDLLPGSPPLDLCTAAERAEDFKAYAIYVASQHLEKFSIRVSDAAGGKLLAARAWNGLWVFHLMSIACGKPCHSLYAACDDPQSALTSINRNVVFTRASEPRLIAEGDIAWARRYYHSFHTLVGDPRFTPAVRALGNAHYLPDLDMAIMLLWAGIEGLLGVDAELSRRLALNGSLLIQGTADEKLAFYQRLKKAYGDRSKVVHGSSLKPEKLSSAASEAQSILIALLRRCVELGRVPTANEFDKVAAAGNLA